MLKIGITGCLGTGKSTVMEILQKQGAKIINTDKLVHELLQRGQSTYAEVIDQLGSDLLDENGQIDRSVLAERVFNDSEALKDLEKIIHPKVREKLENEIKRLEHEGEKVVFVEVPLLFEAGWEKFFDQIWVVSVNREKQLKRLQKSRDYSPEEAQKRIEAQMPLKEKEKRGDLVLDNSGSREHLREQVIAGWRRINA